MLSIESDLRRQFLGYHFEILFYPSGGLIEVQGCEECGTKESICIGQSWGKKRKCKTMIDAVESIKTNLFNLRNKAETLKHQQPTEE